MNDSTMKHCSKCGVLKPLSEFHKDSSKKDGRASTCKPCAKERALKHHADNREKHCEAMRSYYDKNRDEILDYQRRYYKENSEYIKDRVKRYTQTPKGKSVHQAACAKVRIKRRSSRGALTATDIQEQYNHQNGRCYWCKKKVGKTYHVDHVIPLSKGGDNDKWNIVISCPKCNQSKQDKLPHEWTNRLC